MWLALSSFDRISHLGTYSVSLKWWLWKPSRNLLWLPDSIKSVVWVYEMQFRPFWLLIAVQHCVSSLSNCCSLIKPDRAWTFFRCCCCCVLWKASSSSHEGTVLLRTVKPSFFVWEDLTFPLWDISRQHLIQLCSPCLSKNETRSKMFLTRGNVLGTLTLQVQQRMFTSHIVRAAAWKNTQALAGELNMCFCGTQQKKNPT